METKTFLETVLGGSGYYCVFASRTSDNRRVQEFHETIDAVIRAAHSLDEDGFDTYFALATFEESGSRKLTNVKELQSFFLDLDCGPSKPYATKGDALSKVRAVCKELGFPRPTIVDSGRGLHVYWPLTEAVSRETWFVVAERLKALCKQHDLKADPVVTADASRILRIPGTHNHKDEEPKQVYIAGELSKPVEFSKFKALVESNTPLDTAKPVNKYVPKEADAVMDALTGSFKNKFKTILIKTAEGKGCQQLKEIITKQETISEPLWRAGLSIAKFCVDGNQAIYKMSDRHPEFSQDETDYKVSRIKGPYLCERFNEYKPGICEECSHWEKIKSPIVLGREIQEADEEDNVIVQTPKDVAGATPIQYVIPKYPYPFFRGKGGGVFKHSKNKEGEDKDVPVYINDLYVVRRLADKDMGELLVMRLHLPKDGMREFTLPLTAVGSKDEFRKHLAMQGVAVLNVAELMEYTMKWVADLQFKSEAEEARRQFGWTDEVGTSFAFGNAEVFADRVEINSPSSATMKMFPMFHTRGTMEEWLNVLEFYNRPNMEVHQFMIGLSFGAALMHFQPINAAAFHVFSKSSGLGKTTSMLAGASVWGDPDLIMMQERDTFNSKMNRAEVYKNIVCYMDEMTNTAPKELSDWSYQMPSGMQRNRMGASGNAERSRGLPWKTLFGTTGNTSIIERISLYKTLPQAEAQRILEYQATPYEFSNKAETDELVTKLKENYGHGAVPFLQYVIKNLTTVKEITDRAQRRIDEAAGLKAENRFWSALASRTLGALIVAKKAGLINWDLGALFKWTVEVLKQARINFADLAANPEAILTDYLAENYNNILRIKSTDDSRRQSTGLDHLIHPEAIPRAMFVARYEYDVKKLYLLPKPFKEWCGKQQHNYSGLVEALKTGRTKAKREKIRLGKGTHINWPAVDTLVINCSEFTIDEAEQSMVTTASLFQKQDT